ncbi:Photosystem I PsaA/PsaB, partial [Dillenia turbinata]
MQKPINNLTPNKQSIAAPSAQSSNQYPVDNNPNKLMVIGLDDLLNMESMDGCCAEAFFKSVNKNGTKRKHHQEYLILESNDFSHPINPKDSRKVKACGDHTFLSNNKHQTESCTHKPTKVMPFNIFTGEGKQKTKQQKYQCQMPVGFHNFGLYVDNHTMSALGHPQGMFSDTAIQLQPVFAQWIQNTHALAPEVTAPGATCTKLQIFWISHSLIYDSHDGMDSPERIRQYPWVPSHYHHPEFYIHSEKIELYNQEACKDRNQITSCGHFCPKENKVAADI